MTVYHLKMEGAVRDAVMCGRVGASARKTRRVARYAVDLVITTSTG